MIVQEIRKELKEHIDQKYYGSIKRFFKEEIICYGVRTPFVRDISKKYFLIIKTNPKKEIFALCEDLLKSNISEERTIAFDWAFRLKKHYEKPDFNIFLSWLKKYVSNWGACDDLCTHPFGFFIFKYPEFIPRVKKWTESPNRWFRRASAVVMIYSIRKNRYIGDAFKISDMLLLDRDDLVQKGYGWMLKEVSNLYPLKVFHYVMEHKSEMPRTALRYAIEKLVPELKKRAMAK